MEPPLLLIRWGQILAHIQNPRVSLSTPYAAYRPGPLADPVHVVLTWSAYQEYQSYAQQWCATLAALQQAHDEITELKARLEERI